MRILTTEEVADKVQLVLQWAEEELQRGHEVLAVTPGLPSNRIYIRLRGEAKEVIAVWVTVGEYTSRFETYLMPWPEENIAEVLSYLMRRNQRTFPLHLGIGLEDGLYAVGVTETSALDLATLELYIGSSYRLCEEIFPTAMSMGFRSRYHYHPGTGS